MPALVTTLSSRLTDADRIFALARFGRALKEYEALVAEAQERSDHPTEVCARAMAARCALHRADLDGAREHLQLAALRLDPLHQAAHGRYRGSLARLALAEGPPEVARHELMQYLRWADDDSAHENVIDACVLLARASADTSDGTTARRDEHREWLQRAIDHAQLARLHAELGPLFRDLATAHEQDGLDEEALEAWQQSASWFRRLGSPRQIASAAWAAGAVAVRLEDWPAARSILEEVVDEAGDRDDLLDVVALALADLARANEAAGDVIEARRLVLRALHLGREVGLAGFWPERWTALLQHARLLELDA